jgi:hypothetical protein
MSTPPVDPEVLRQTVECWRETGNSQAQGHKLFEARYASINFHTFKTRLEDAKRKGFHLSEGARHSAVTAHLSGVEVRGGHRRVYDADGKQIDTVRWSAPADTVDDDTIERIAAAFQRIEPLAPQQPPEKVVDDLCTLWPLYDVHWGMHAWGQETGGQDYDLKLARDDLLCAFERVLAQVPCTAHAVLLIGGDFFHADDNRNETPAHRHRLDSDTRFFKTVDTAIATLCFVVQRLLTKSSRVTIRVLRGNHDEHSHRFLTVGLSQRFRDCAVQVEQDERDLFMFQWGRCALFAHHGDKQTPKDWILGLADKCPYYSGSPHRYAYTGHRHAYAAERIGGTLWQRLDAFCPPDAYGSTWTSRRAFGAEVFHKLSGRTLIACDPLERDGAA